MKLLPLRPRIFPLFATKLFLNYITYLILFVLQQRMIQFVPFQRQQLLNLTLKSRIAHVEITNDIATLIRSIIDRRCATCVTSR